MLETLWMRGFVLFWVVFAIVLPKCSPLAAFSADKGGV
jgi:hypothetical protein